ncbi:hypothetical protein GCM10008171_03940 [Methylopila jiangsuensis]|uniref:Uncharacterized protein n=1 Tax=Methylopila jiangsuensis TaxID=586230 RepID=A0A9W6JFW9_9HYPH|nr:hypothetical protein GCM10008171_03940 [Methylopila jiangsuensis]
MSDDWASPRRRACIGFDRANARSASCARRQWRAFRRVSQKQAGGLSARGRCVADFLQAGRLTERALRVARASHLSADVEIYNYEGRLPERAFLDKTKKDLCS